MSQSFSLRWLIDFLKAGFSWITKNPLLIVLVIVIVSYNEFVPKLGIDFTGFSITNALSIWNLAVKVIHFFTSGPGILLWLVTFTFATGITMFNSGVMLAVFSGYSHPGRVGIRTALSKSWFEYMLLQIAASLIAVLSGFLLLWVIVKIFSLTGIVGSILIGVFLAIVYPLFYAAMSAGSVILAPLVPLKEKISFARILLRKNNAFRLGTYYLIRIGGETIVAYAGLLIAHALHVSAVWTGIVFVIIVSLPYALVRTTGLVIKLDMLREAPWFAVRFAEYYATRKKAA